MNKQDATWVFGYGSLIWKQDFPFLESRPASVTGWSRRFWQGSHDHRGTVDAPGRVVTLVPSVGEVCAGRAFLVEHNVFEHLDHREKNGYERVEVAIDFSPGRVQGVFYHAGERNFAFLGPAPVEEIALHIVRSQGPSGRNIDYLLELARALREMGIEDPHIYEIEALARQNA